MLRQLLLFAMAGGFATALHYALLVALVQAQVSVVMASSVGAVFGALLNYGINRRFTFRSRRAHRQALPRYLLIAAAGFVINGYVITVALNARLHYLAAQVIATATVLLWNFVIHRWWTFRGEGYA